MNRQMDSPLNSLHSSSTSRTYRDSGQQPLRDISYHNGHEEDHGPQERVANAHGHHKKCGTKENGQACDDVHKMFDLDSNGCFLIFYSRCQRCDAPDDGAVTRVHHQALSCACSGAKRVTKGQAGSNRGMHSSVK